MPANCCCCCCSSEDITYFQVFRMTLPFGIRCGCAFFMHPIPSGISRILAKHIHTKWMSENSEVRTSTICAIRLLCENLCNSTWANLSGDTSTLFHFSIQWIISSKSSTGFFSLSFCSRLPPYIISTATFSVLHGKKMHDWLLRPFGPVSKSHSMQFYFSISMQKTSQFYR